MNYDLLEKLLSKASEDAFDKMDALVVAGHSDSVEHWVELGRMNVFDSALETCARMEKGSEELYDPDVDEDVPDAMLAFLRDYVLDGTLNDAAEEGVNKPYLLGMQQAVAELDEVLDLVWLDDNVTRR